MGGTPDLLFVIDTNKEQLAIKEAQRLGIPVAAIVDTNCDPQGITFPVPANDDAGRAISLYCDLVARAAIDGISRGHGELGLDIGAAEAPIIEELPANTNEAPEQTEQFELLTAPRGAPDDLTKLNGVGPQLEKKLNDAGIYHYWQLAAMKPEDVQKIDTDLKLHGRIERDGWIAQARAAIEAA
ncbi:MAG: rpsB [Microvirga sp.]|nr:rpsB [Microvirga sp.]